MSDIEIRKIYKGLSRIEETFRITKSELDTRPIHVTTNEHIESHFTTCFAAITLLRLLEISLGEQISSAADHRIAQTIQLRQHTASKRSSGSPRYTA